MSIPGLRWAQDFHSGETEVNDATLDSNFPRCSDCRGGPGIYRGVHGRRWNCETPVLRFSGLVPSFPDERPYEESMRF